MHNLRNLFVLRNSRKEYFEKFKNPLPLKSIQSKKLLIFKKNLKNKIIDLTNFFTIKILLKKKQIYKLAIFFHC